MNFQAFFDLLDETPRTPNCVYVRGPHGERRTMPISDLAERRHVTYPRQTPTPRRRTLLDIQLENDLREVRIRHSERTLRG